MPGVQDRVIVVTGAGGGLGREYALTLAKEGASVVVNDLGGARDGTGAGSAMADEVVKEIKDAGGRAVANYDSVAESEGAENIIKTAIDEFGKVDGVVSNAGILRDGTFHKMEFANWDAVLKVHLYGGYNVIRAAWPHFREQSFGRVVVATSTSGLFGNFGQANYGAAKLGLVGLINTLAQEGAKYNIKANAVAPIAATRMTQDILPPEVFEKLTPEYVAPVVAYLCTEEVPDTASVFIVGGGKVQRTALFQNEGVTFSGVPSVDDVAVEVGRDHRPVGGAAGHLQPRLSPDESACRAGAFRTVWTGLHRRRRHSRCRRSKFGRRRRRCGRGVFSRPVAAARRVPAAARAAVRPGHGGRRSGAVGARRVRIQTGPTGVGARHARRMGGTGGGAAGQCDAQRRTTSTTPRPSRCWATTTRCISRWPAAARCGRGRPCWCSARRAASAPPPFRSPRRWAPR